MNHKPDTTDAATHTTDWTHGWEEMTDQFDVFLSHPRTRAHAIAYVKGLLSPVERKNGWQLAEALDYRTPDALQYLLERANWDAETAVQELQRYVSSELGDENAAFIVDETGFLKKGLSSAGVQRQYSGTAGRIENCQIGVFLAYASQRGRTLVDRKLYIPESWCADKERCKRAKIPIDQKFATKPQLAIDMLSRAMKAGLSAAWVLGDEVYGNAYHLRRWCENQKQPYVLCVSRHFRVWHKLRQVRVDAMVKQAPLDAWERITCGNGTKGPRVYDWAFLKLPLPATPHGWMRGILFRRSIKDLSDISYYAVFSPDSTSMQKMAIAAGMRWAVEECFESAKGEVGLDHYEVRRLNAWYRHMTLAMWAHAYLTVQRAHALKKKKTSETEEQMLIPLTVPEIRHLLIWLKWHHPPDPDHVLHWSWWRRNHQAIALNSHYERYRLLR